MISSSSTPFRSVSNRMPSLYSVQARLSVLVSWWYTTCSSQMKSVSATCSTRSSSTGQIGREARADVLAGALVHRVVGEVHLEGAERLHQALDELGDL